MNPLLARFAVCALLAAPAWAAAQAPATVVVKVQIVDTANVAIRDVGITIVEGLNTTIASGLTNNRGRVDLTIPRSSDQREVVARKIGLTRAGSFFHPTRDTVAVLITMHRQPQQLEAVKVSEREDFKRRSYHADADEIAASTRTIFDGMDVLTKMKPDILYGRSPGCGARSVWINGKLVRGVLADPMVQARMGPRSPMTRANTNQKAMMGSRPLPAPSIFSASQAVLTIMAGIQAEHIAEINYVDCFQKTEVLRGNSALYVVLKDGIGWDGRKTYVVDNQKLPFKQAELMLPPEPALPESTAVKLTPASSTPETPAALNASYRRRLVGVFDETTGLPVADVELVDVASGTIARTTITGTLTLAFLPEGQSQVEVRRAGYQPLKLEISISPRDTMPITLTLTPKKP